MSARGCALAERTPRIRPRPRTRLANHCRRGIERRLGSAGRACDDRRRRRRDRQFGVPGPTGFEQEVRTLLLADGRGYVKLLRHDAERRVMLQERLGPQLSQLDWPIRDQMRSDLRDVATRLDRRAARLRAEERSREGAQPGRTDRAPHGRNSAGRAASAPSSARSPSPIQERSVRSGGSVLVHADAHSQNTLQLAGANPRTTRHSSSWILTACVRSRRSISRMMRELERRVAGERRRRSARDDASICRLDRHRSEPIWQWGFMERMSTGRS